MDEVIKVTSSIMLRFLYKYLILGTMKGVKMKYFKIKGLDKEVSRVMMGTGWFSLEDEDVIFELLDTYVKAGGNVIDTGRFYNGGKSEKVLTKWLNSRNNRDGLIIINKACHHYVDENNVHYSEKNRVGAQYITEDLEYSLNNMEVEYFDIYEMHRDNVEVPVSELMDRLEQHRLEGKIKTYGVSNWSNERVEEANEYCKSKGYLGISVNNPSFSLANVNKPRWVGCVYVDADYVKRCNDDGISIVSWGAQGAGFFVPLWKDINKDAPQDIREAYFTEENFERLKRAEEIAKIKGNDVEPINVALAYVIDERMDVAASIGPRKKSELQSSLKALDIKLTSEEINYLELKSDKLN